MTRSFSENLLIIITSYKSSFVFKYKSSKLYTLANHIIRLVFACAAPLCDASVTLMALRQALGEGCQREIYLTMAKFTQPTESPIHTNHFQICLTACLISCDRSHACLSVTADRLRSESSTAVVQQQGSISFFYKRTASATAPLSSRMAQRQNGSVCVCVCIWVFMVAPKNWNKNVYTAKRYKVVQGDTHFYTPDIYVPPFFEKRLLCKLHTQIKKKNSIAIVLAMNREFTVVWGQSEVYKVKSHAHGSKKW